MNTYYFKGIKFLVPFLLILFSFTLSCFADSLPFVPIAPSQARFLSSNGNFRYGEFTFMSVSADTITYTIGAENSGFNSATLYFDLQEQIYNDISFDLTVIPSGSAAVGTSFTINEISSAIFYNNSSITDYTNIYGNNLNRQIHFEFRPNQIANKLKIEILNSDLNAIFTKNGLQIKFSNIVINNAIFSVANEINEKIDSSTQEIIENQNDNTQAIIDNQNENHRELMDADTEEDLEFPDIPDMDFPSPTGPDVSVFNLLGNNVFIYIITTFFVAMQNNVYCYMLIWLCFMMLFIPFVIRMLKR